MTADPATLGGFLDEIAARFGPNEALVGGDAVRWTYADLHAEAARVGRDLLALGVEPGEPVGILMGNRPEAVAAFFGAAQAGRWPCCCRPSPPGPSWPACSSGPA